MCTQQHLLMANIGATNTFPKAGIFKKLFMTPIQIETMIDRIIALFPSTPIPKNTIRAGWVQDEFLLNADVADGREALNVLLQRCDRFPNLKQVHDAINSFRATSTQEVLVCQLCDGTGWDTGITEQQPLGYRYTVNGQEYSYVKKCVCRKLN